MNHDDHPDMSAVCVGLQELTASVTPNSAAANWPMAQFAGDFFYTTEEMAKILKVDSSTLRRWRRLKIPKGPKATCISERTWRYYHADFVEWLNGRRNAVGAA
ncbi:MAG: helix-turn-helix domain-containing protein [Mycobacterium sp.]